MYVGNGCPLGTEDQLLLIALRGPLRVKRLQLQTMAPEIREITG